MNDNTSPIRVLCVFSTLDRGGAESMCMNLYRHMDREKVQFDFVKHTASKGAFEDEIVSLGGRIFAAPRFKVYNRGLYERWWKEFLQTHPEYAIIHGHWFSVVPAFAGIAHQYGRIVISHSHCTKSVGTKDISERIKESIKHLYLRKLEGVSDYCFACSRPAGAWLFPNKPFKVLNNAIDTERFSFNDAVRADVRKELQLENYFVIGTVGRIMHQKNPQGIVEIFRAIHAARPDARLLWVGDGPLREEAKQLIAKYALQDAVIMTGVRPDVNRLMQAMDAFILPSFYEGLPVVAIEAQAAGLPCFLSDKIADEVAITGLCTLLPNDRPQEWVSAFVSVDTLIRKDMSSQIRKAGYDIRQTAEWLCNFYLSIGEKNGEQ